MIIISDFLILLIRIAKIRASFEKVGIFRYFSKAEFDHNSRVFKGLFESFRRFIQIFGGAEVLLTDLVNNNRNCAEETNFPMKDLEG